MFSTTTISFILSYTLYILGTRPDKLIKSSNRLPKMITRTIKSRLGSFPDIPQNLKGYRYTSREADLIVYYFNQMIAVFHANVTVLKSSARGLTFGDYPAIPPHPAWLDGRGCA